MKMVCIDMVKNREKKMKEWVKVHCQWCQIDINGNMQWLEHQKTRKHKALVRKNFN